MELLKKLCNTYGVSGRETDIRAVVREELKKLTDDQHTDALGNVISLKRGNGKLKVMLAGHMDEIGFMVSYIDDKGFLTVVPMGGIDTRTLTARRVMVHGRKELPGVMMNKSKPLHMAEDDDKKKPKVSDFFIDLGLDKEEVTKLVKVGDTVSYDVELTTIGKNVSAKSLDDRIGVYVMLETLKRLKNPQADVFAVSTVQEEVGVRGAIVSAFGVEPDVAIALDVTLAIDTPGGKEEDRVSTLGGGVAIKLMDSGSICHPKLVDAMVNLAEKNNIKYQMEILPRGGTDAMGIQKSRAGVPVITLSIPTRYIHTPTEMVSMDDVEATIKLIVAFIEEAHNIDLSL